MLDALSAVCEAMRVINLARVGPYLERVEESDVSASIRAWVFEVKAAIWNDVEELRKRFPNADLTTAGRVVFHLGGGRHVVAAQVNFGSKILVIRFVGTIIAFSQVRDSVWQATS